MPLTAEVLLAPSLLYLLLLALHSLGVLALPFLPGVWQGLLLCLLGTVVAFSMLHKIQRGALPKDPVLSKARLDWMVLIVRGDQLWVSGLVSPLRVKSTRLPLARMDIQLRPRGTERWQLALTPENGKTLKMMDISCSEAEARALSAHLQERVARAAERHGQGTAEVPPSLHTLTEPAR